jgi:sugar O-acyltransferase (sialic acid O-acetyltransferase NeuD family)
MTELVLVAAGGLGREVLAVERPLGRYTGFLFLDDDPHTWGSRVAGTPVLGGLDRLRDLDDHDVVVCAGRGQSRRALVERARGLGVPEQRFASVRHPSVDVPAGCTVGAGSILLAQVAMTSDVRVGRHVVAMPHATLTHDDEVADFATLCAGVSLGGGVRVGEAAYLGMNASVRERVSVGAGATLGMGAALLSDLPDHETWVGVPARPVLAVRSATDHWGESA